MEICLDKFDLLLVGLTLLALVAMTLPMVLFPYPSFINNGDLALHYKLSSLVHENWSYLSFELYPKLFHIMVSILLIVFPWLGIVGGMTAVTAAFLIFLPLAMYKLSMEVIGDRRVSVLSAFFSVTLLVHNSAFVGLALTVPQTLAMTLSPAIFYFFLKHRYALAGVTLGVLMLTHGSWPILVVFMLLYPFTLPGKDRYALLKVAILSSIVGFVIALPFTIYNKAFLFHDTINSTVVNSIVYITSMISIFSVPLILVPFFSVILYVSGGWRLFRKGGRGMFVLWFLALLLVTSQAFLLLNSGHIFGLVFIASRVLFLLFIPLSMLCAYGLAWLTRGNKAAVLAVAVVFLLSSAAYYYPWYEHKSVKLDAEDIAAAEFLAATGDRNSMVLFNPLRYNLNEHFVVMTGLQDFDLRNEYLLLSGYNKSVSDVDYVLANRNDSALMGFVDSNSWRLSEVYSNGKYRIFKVIERFESSDPTDDTYMRGFSFFYNQNTKLKGIFSEPISIAVSSGGSRFCMRVQDRMDPVECGYDADITISGDGRYIRELFSTYSISEFAYRMLWFYGNGMLNITTSSMLSISLSVPVQVPGIIGSNIELSDLGVYAHIERLSGGANITLSSKRNAETKYYATSLKSVSRITRWVLVNSWFTFPNAIWGLAYDAITGK